FGTTGDGWYSYNLGAWHLISLNIECADEPGGCSPNGNPAAGTWLARETQWLAQGLNEGPSPCTLAHRHHPKVSSTVPASSGTFKDDSDEGKSADAWWKLLYQHHADLILNGHDHVYSRFAPMDPNGNADPQHGIREFIIGTGGESLDTVEPSNT